MMPINTRADLEAIRGTPEFESALRMLFGATARWELVDGAWVLHEDLVAVESLGYTKESFLAEVEPLNFEAPSPPSTPPVPSLAALKISLKAQIDAAAEVERLKYITLGSGQAMTYQQKAAEAAACLEDPEPLVDDYPLVAAEIGITGQTLSDVAAAIHAAYQAWRYIGAQIEAARLGGKAAVDAAVSAEQAQAVFDSLEWPLPPQA